MLGVLRKRWNRKQILDMKTEEDDKEELQDVAPPPSYIRISDGKVSLVQPLSCDTVTKDKSRGPPMVIDEVLEERIVELEEALLRLQEKVNNSQCGSPTFERDLREQLENMNRAMKSKDRKTVQACRDNKALQARFARQEVLLHNLQQENKALTLRIRQYDRCLDDVMRKVVDAIVLEDSLRQEVAVLKSRVYELEAQNAALSASPAKGKDEGYCTMSSGQPQPSNGHLEDLPEEPEQWLLPAEPCSTEMEDWSMSQDELGVITLDDEVNDQEHERDHEHDWIWNTSDFLNSTMIASQSEGISKLLQQTIVYSEDEEVACVDFTKDFYKLVNIPSGSTRSLYSYLDAETDDEDDTTSENCRTRGPSPTPSEAGRAQVTSCSSSESDEHTRCILELPELVSSCSYEEPSCILRNNNQRDEVDNVQTAVQSEETTPTNVTPVSMVAVTTTTSVATPTTAGLNSGPSWRRSNGWKRLPSLESPKKEMRSEKPSPTSLSPSTPPISRIPTCKQSSPIRKSKIPPPVPVRRSYAS